MRGWSGRTTTEERAVARAALAILVATAVGLLMFAGPYSYSGTAIARQSPTPTESPTESPTGSPTGSPSPTESPGPTIAFLNPSGYSDDVSNKTDANDFYTVLVRALSPETTPSINIEISSDGGDSFSPVGEAQRVRSSDTYRFLWNVFEIEDDSYILRAQIPGTDETEDREIEVDNSFETLDISAPGNTDRAAFIEGVVGVAGTASAGAEKAFFFYTKTAANERRDSDQWVECGELELDGGGEEPQEVNGSCELDGEDQPDQVTGLAAAAVDCNATFGCDAPFIGESTESGDAHRVTGFDASPRPELEPSGGRGSTGTCLRIEITVRDGDGEPIAGRNLDLHLAGPGEDPGFCDPSGGASERRAPDMGPEDDPHATQEGEEDESFHEESGARHTEGETGSNGTFVVGIESSETGESAFEAWVDSDDNDEQDEREGSVSTTYEWIEAGNCTIVGDSGDDVLEGTSGRDVICGFGGDDVLLGKRGNDVLRGDSGDDVLRGGGGRDRLVGNNHRDTLLGGGGPDTLRAGRGHDVLRGRRGNDTLRGGPGSDDLNGGKGRDRCFGGKGDDKIRRCE